MPHPSSWQAAISDRAGPERAAQVRPGCLPLFQRAIRGSFSLFGLRSRVLSAGEAIIRSARKLSLCLCRSYQGRKNSKAGGTPAFIPVPRQRVDLPFPRCDKHSSHQPHASAGIRTGPARCQQGPLFAPFGPAGPRGKRLSCLSPPIPTTE